MRQVNLENHLIETIEVSNDLCSEISGQSSLMSQFNFRNKLSHQESKAQVMMKEIGSQSVKAPKVRKRSFKGYNSQNRNRSSWSHQEDQILFKLKIENFSWRKIAQEINMKLYENRQVKDAKQARERWNNYLNPNLIKGDWSDQENELLINLYFKMGPKWSQISKMLGTRNENQVKSHTLTLLNKIQKSKQLHQQQTKEKTSTLQSSKKPCRQELSEQQKDSLQEIIPKVNQEAISYNQN